ncbi:signal peptidase I [Candidatus Gracilibacteria bacterium]|nr:signal peptidase I [Candidatus Gracilibacteria bacterium]
MISKKEIIDFFKDIIVILLVVFVIRTFFILPFQINGQSMYTSYYDGEFIIVDRFSYRFLHKPNRGDVIVFKPHVSQEKQYFLKRIIGLPGDKIKIEGGKVYVFSKSKNKFIELDEKYLSQENNKATYVSGDKGSHIYEVPEDSYFVMGDNRNHSTDSRACFSSCYIDGSTNFIKTDDITGKLFLDLGYFRISKFDFVHPALGIITKPKWFNTSSEYDYGI